MGIRIDGNNDLINAADGTLTIEGISVNVVGVSTASGGFKVGTAYTVFPNGNVATAGVVTATSGVHISGSGADLTMNSAGTIFTGNGGNESDPIIRNVSDTNTGVFFPAGDTLAVTTGGSEALRIDSSRRLLLGRTSGSFALDVETGSDSTFRISNSGESSHGSHDAKIVAGGTYYQNPTIVGSSIKFRTYNGSSEGERISIDSNGRLGIQGAATRGLLEVRASGGSNTMLTAVFGANEGTTAGTLSDDTDKAVRMGIHHYDTDALPFGFLVGSSSNGVNNLTFGGGTSLMNTATEIKFNTGANSTTTSGTNRFEINSDGDVKVVSRGSSDSGAPFYVAVTGKSSIDYGGGSNDTACLRIKDNGSTNSYYHGIEFRGKRDGDARIYMQDMGSDACDLAFATDNSGITEKMRITAAGRIGINKTDPEAQLHVYKPNHYVLTNSGKAVHHIHTSGPNGNAGEYGGAISFAMGSTGAAAVAGLQGGADADNVGLAFITHDSGTGSADAVEKMRITSDGRIQANTQTTSDNEKYNFFFSATADNQNCFTIRNDNSYENVALIIKHGRGGLSGFSGKAVSFRGNDFTEEGSIVIGTTSVAYNTSSDYRLKENQVAISDGITRLKTLKPYRFNFKKDTGTTVDGFFAHEVTAVPEAVFGEKDAMKKIYYEEGDTLPSGKNVGDFKEFSSTEISAQSIDHSKLVPLLTAALQEEISKREALEARVAALEGS